MQSLQDDTASLLKRLKLDLPTYYDPDGGTQYALSKVIDLEAYPTTLLLDRRGVIRAVWVGYRPGVETKWSVHGVSSTKSPKPPEDHHGGTEGRG